MNDTSGSIEWEDKISRKIVFTGEIVPVTLFINIDREIRRKIIRRANIKQDIDTTGSSL